MRWDKELFANCRVEMVEVGKSLKPSLARIIVIIKGDQRECFSCFGVKNSQKILFFFAAFACSISHQEPLIVLFLPSTFTFATSSSASIVPLRFLARHGL